MPIKKRKGVYREPKTSLSQREMRTLKRRMMVLQTLENDFPYKLEKNFSYYDMACPGWVDWSVNANAGRLFRHFVKLNQDRAEMFFLLGFSEKGREHE